ncbi:MAG: tRNA pseudouridine synthase A [Bdellovibrionota bacterium]
MGLLRSGDHLGLRVTYCGSDFFGSQHQPNRPSVQSTLEDAFFQITKQKVRLSSLSRTDSGVHAFDAVFFWRQAFDRWPKLKAVDFYRLWGSLNAVLPNGIQIRQLGTIAKDFSPKQDVLWKEYRYQIWHSRRSNPLLEKRVWWVYEALDLLNLERELKYLEGTHDFSSFSKSSAQALKESGKSTIRTILLTKLKLHQDPAFPEARRLELIFRADGFLRHMVRNLVGTLIEQARKNEGNILKVLKAKNRKMAGYRAPAEGLVLYKTQLKRGVFRGLYPKQLRYSLKSIEPQVLDRL